MRQDNRNYQAGQDMGIVAFEPFPSGDEKEKRLETLARLRLRTKQGQPPVVIKRSRDSTKQCDMVRLAQHTGRKIVHDSVGFCLLHGHERGTVAGGAVWRDAVHSPDRH